MYTGGRTFQGLFLLVCLCAYPWLDFGEILDRIAVTVDKQVITLGDIVRELRVDAFLDRKPVDLSAAAKRKAAERLVDQILILREAADSHLTLALPEDAAGMVAQAKSQFATDQQYRSALAEYRITEADLSQHLLDGLRALRFTDLRFRPQIQLSEADLREYYETLATKWLAAQRPQIPSFEQSRSQIETLLTEDRVTKALDTWLEMQRATRQIQFREAAFQ